MGGQQFQQFFAAGTRSSILGPVPLGVAIKTPHMGFPPRHFHPHARYFNNDFQSRQPDRKRENEHRPAIAVDSQSAASSSRNETAAVAEANTQSSTQQLDEPETKKQKTNGENNPLETKAVTQSTDYAQCAENPDIADGIPEADGTMAGTEAAEAVEQSRAAEVEDPEPMVEDIDQPKSSSQAESADLITLTDGKENTAKSNEGETGGETTNKFYCYICNITCHNQQNFQSHMNALAHQQRMMEIQHMSNACLVTLLPRVQESLQGGRKDGDKRPGLQRWCATCRTHFTCNVMEHRKTKEHKICSRSSNPSCTVCMQQFKTSREFIDHMKTTEHKEHMEQLLKETGTKNLQELGLEVSTVGVDEEGLDSEEEKLDEENGQEVLPVQMEVTLEDITEDEEFDSDTVYGSSFVIPVAGFLCRLCNEFYYYEKSARRSHCKTQRHFENLKRYKALKVLEDSTFEVSVESVCTSVERCHKGTESVPEESCEDLQEDSPLHATEKPICSTESHCPKESPSSSLSSDLAVNIRLTSSEEAPHPISSSTSNGGSVPPSPKSPSQLKDDMDEPLATEPDDEDDTLDSVSEEKTNKGRGRTPTKKRGRGGRRR